MTGLRNKVVHLLHRLGVYEHLVPFYVALVGARRVHPGALFALREVTRRKGVFLYRLRSSGLRVAIRHGAGDAVVLSEVFQQDNYVPPLDVQQALARVDQIVDLGGNIGLFAVFAAAEWPGAQIVAFEPDPDNATLHRRAIAENGLGDRWQLVEAAAGDHDGRVAFMAGQAAWSHIAEAGESGVSIEVPLVDALPYISRADLLKMDMEGGEWAIMSDGRFHESPLKALVLEYHTQLCPGSDARAEARSILEAAGFHVHPSWHSDDEGHGMLWAWRNSAPPA